MAAIASEAETLRAELDALKASLVDSTSDRAPWPFSPTERRIFGMLLAGDVVSKQTIALMLHDGRDPSATDLKAIDVFISRIRGKTAGQNLVIETIHGRGYRLHDREAWSKAITLGAAARH